MQRRKSWHVYYFEVVAVVAFGWWFVAYPLSPLLFVSSSVSLLLPAAAAWYAKLASLGSSSAPPLKALESLLLRKECESVWLLDFGVSLPKFDFGPRSDLVRTHEASFNRNLPSSPIIKIPILSVVLAIGYNFITINNQAYNFPHTFSIPLNPGCCARPTLAVHVLLASDLDETVDVSPRETHRDWGID